MTEYHFDTFRGRFWAGLFTPVLCWVSMRAVILPGSRTLLSPSVSLVSSVLVAGSEKLQAWAGILVAVWFYIFICLCIGWDYGILVFIFLLPLFSWFGSYLAAVLVEIYTGKAHADFNCVLDEAWVSSAGVLNGENGTSRFRVRVSK